MEEYDEDYVLESLIEQRRELRQRISNTIQSINHAAINGNTDRESELNNVLSAYKWKLHGVKQALTEFRFEYGPK